MVKWLVDGVPAVVRFCSPTEIAVLRALPPHARTEAFFSFWTRKEAYVKARGGGLSIPFKAFTVSLDPGESVVLWDSDSNSQETARWYLYGLTPIPGFVAALAVEGRGCRLKCWRCPETGDPAPALI